MDHVTDVGLVDAHAERDSGHHHIGLVAAKGVLRTRARPRFHACVIGQGAHPAALQVVCSLLSGFPGQAVYDAALLAAARHQAQNAVAHTRGVCAFAIDRQVQVGPKKTAAKGGGRLHAQLLADVVHHLGGRGRGERQYRGIAEAGLESGQIAIRWTEIVPPLADAMGFVHREQARTHAPHERSQRRLQTLGRGIDQFEFATQHRRHAPAALVGLQAGIEKSRAQSHL